MGALKHGGQRFSCRPGVRGRPADHQSRRPGDKRQDKGDHGRRGNKPIHQVDKLKKWLQLHQLPGNVTYAQGNREAARGDDGWLLPMRQALTLRIHAGAEPVPPRSSTRCWPAPATTTASAAPFAPVAPAPAAGPGSVLSNRKISNALRNRDCSRFRHRRGRDRRLRACQGVVPASRCPPSSASASARR